MANDKQPILLFTLFRTDNPYSSISLSMAKEFARERPVYYINHPYSWKDVVKGLLQGDAMLRRRLPAVLFGALREERLEKIPERFIAFQPPATWPINWMPKGWWYDRMQAWNNRIVLRFIRKVIRRYQLRDFVYINCYDPFFAGVLPKDFGAYKSFYHCIDDITQDAYTAKHGFDLEKKAIQETDITLVTSSNLYALKKPFARQIETFFNAADVTVFSRVLTERFAPPAELAGRSGRVIGFIGNLDALRIDYPLLKRLADHFTEDTLLLVGPVNSPAVRELGLDRQTNVILTGSKDLEDLPPYLQYMDCVLIPFLCNTLTRSIYPLKINEYLAAGKAVVSSSFSEDIRGFSELIYLADNHEEFLRQTETALAENDPALLTRRTMLAAANTWAARIQQLESLAG